MSQEQGSINLKTGDRTKPKKSDFLYSPFVLIVPIFFFYFFKMIGIEMSWKGFGLGALGWFIALVLRGPLSVVTLKLTTKEKASLIIGGSSGPLEELTRLVVLLLTASTFSWSASIGQGWAAIEIPMALVNAIAIYSLMNRTDEKALQAKEILEAQGMTGHHPLWGTVERLFASAFHIGATLIVAAVPWLVILLIPLHSFLNLGVVNVLKRTKSAVKAEGVVAVLGTVVFIVGLMTQIM